MACHRRAAAPRRACRRPPPGRVDLVEPTEYLLRLVIIGATGYIGARLAAAGRARFEVLGTSSRAIDGLQPLDLAQPPDDGAPWLRAGDVVCVTAAISSPDVCAREYDRARAVNVVGTSRFVRQALGRGARVIFFASDTVYGEQAEAFDESAAIAPAGEYAAMKAEVESSFAAEPGFKSIRLSYVFSAGDKFTRYLGGCARRGETAEVFDPFVRSVVHLDDVVAGVLALADRWSTVPAPHLNFGGPAAVSRLEFATTLQRLAWPALRFTVTEPPAAFFAARPRHIPMNSPWLARLLGRPPATLAQAVAAELTHLEH